ncbi:MAG: hypothetical protein HOO06_14315 [Bdellovibrionaceae bacterium]|nr:hypothetical protein [Pseudobdellovibrionaceae bacterium]
MKFTLLIIHVIILMACSHETAQSKIKPQFKKNSFNPPSAPKETKLTPPKQSGKPSLLAQEEIKCPIAGHSFSWESGYCLWTSNSKAIHEKAAQKCLNTPRKRVHLLPECEKRIYFKKKMCKHAIKLGYITMGYQMCVKNPEFDKTWPKK